jgi:hypothetical protein
LEVAGMAECFCVLKNFRAKSNISCKGNAIKPALLIKISVIADFSQRCKNNRLT